MLANVNQQHNPGFCHLSGSSYVASRSKHKMSGYTQPGNLIKMPINYFYMPETQQQADEETDHIQCFR